MDQAWTSFSDETDEIVDAFLKFVAFEGFTKLEEVLALLWVSWVRLSPRFDLREVVDMLTTYYKCFGMYVIADLLLLWIVDRFIGSSGVLFRSEFIA
eukprot:gene25570-34129_t